MQTKVSKILGALVVYQVICGGNPAQAVQYPPGPGGAYPDTLIKVEFIQNPAAVPHPVAPDTVRGIGGIITGFDPIATGFAIYIQNSQGGPWSGVDVFTGGTNYITLYTPNLAIGDSLMTYGRLDEFAGETELRGFASSAFSAPLPGVRRISTGNPLPPFHLGTVNELQELPTNPNAEQWEGCLVRVQHQLRVVRTSLTPGLGTPNSFLAVEHVECPDGSVGPCDSLFVDGSTLTAIAPPPLGSLVDKVQGIYNQRTRGFRIQLRDADDLFDNSPPSLLDAYSISPDSVRVVFDRELTTASAQNVLNYTLQSTLGPPDGAKRQADHRIVHVKVTNGLAAGDPEGVTVNGLVNDANHEAMTFAQSRSFFNGITPLSLIQAPDPAALAGAPCQDRSKFAGPGNQSTGGRITTRGVCTLKVGSDFWIQDAAGGARSGVVLFAPTNPLVVGHQYVIAGGIQEFFAETEVVGTVYIKDEGVVAPPAAIVQPVGALRDTSCDAAQSVATGEDYEGVLVKVVDVKTVEERSAGQSFLVAGPYPSNPDTILIGNGVARTFDPTKNQYVTVTGVLDVAAAVARTTFRIQPRGNADIVVNPTLAVDDQLPTSVSFAIAPNPARSSRVTFGLPKRERVQISIYDLAGRKRAVVADGEFPAGVHSLDWDGRDRDGNPVGSGVYFYKMEIAGQTYKTRGVLLN